MRRMREQCRMRRGMFFCSDGQAPPPVVAGYTFTELSAADVTSDPAIVARGRAERFGARHTAGNRAFGFRAADGALAAYFWCAMATERPITTSWEIGSTVMIPRGTAYIWDCFTVPAHRQRGLYTRGLRALRVFAGGRGCVRVMVAAAGSNTPSIAGIVAAGFHPVGAFTVFRVGSHTMFRIAGRGTSFRRDGDPHPFPFPDDVV